jgi:hypothetical protein
MKISAHLFATAVIVAAVGCEEPQLPSKAPAATAEATPAPAPVEEERPMVAGAPGEKLPEIETPVTSTPRPFTSHDPIKGRRSRRAGGYLGATAGARFHAEYQMIINNIQHAHQLYWAETGDWAKSNEEFMTKIVAGNKLVLPELEPQHEYIYVPEQPEVGLQIRLKPGFAQDGTPLAGGEAAADAPPAEAGASTEAPATTPEPESGRDDAGNPLDLRERAAGIGGPALDVE